MKDRYRLFPLWGRIILIIVIGIAPAAFGFLEEAELVDLEFENSKNNLEATKNEFEKKRIKIENIGKIEEEKKFVEVQLSEAKNRLPDEFNLEKDLKEVTKAAENSNITLALFRPSLSPLTKGDTYKYESLPITIEAYGKFHQLAHFFDSLAHFETMVDLRKLQMTSHLKEADEEDKNQSKNGVDPRVIRLNAEVKAIAELNVFRSAPEANTDPVQGKDEAGKKNKDSNDKKENKENKDKVEIE